LVARWISPGDGDWNDPSRWDIGRVPNNTADETFAVFIGEHPATIRIEGQITITRLQLGAGETLDLRDFDTRLRVLDRFEWSDGVVAGSGQLVSGGHTVIRRQGEGTLALAGPAELVFQGSCSLEAMLRCESGAVILVTESGQLDVHPGAGLLDPEGQSLLNNRGTLAVHSDIAPFPCIPIESRGTIRIGRRVVQFPGSFPDDPHLAVFDGAVHLEDSTLEGVVDLQEGLLEGVGSIRAATVDDPVSGRFQFGDLELMETAWSRFVLGRPHDRFHVGGRLELGGVLEFALDPALTPRPDDVFEIVRADGGIAGQFLDFDGEPFEFGNRYPVEGGSIYLEMTPDSKAVRASSYLPPPVPLDAAALRYDFTHGCFVAPHGAIDLGSDDWAEGAVSVEITTGYNAAVDRLSLRQRLEYPDSSRIRFVGQPRGEQTVIHRDVLVGTVRIEGSSLTCELEAGATPESVVALLLAIHYGNTDLTPEWFQSPTNQYPAHTIRTTLVDGAGGRTEVTRAVEFPRMVGISLGGLPISFTTTSRTEQFEVTVLGIFSGGEMRSLPHLRTTWRLGGDGRVSYTVNTSVSPGMIAFSTAEREPFCFRLRSTVEGLEAENSVYFRPEDDLTSCILSEASYSTSCEPVPETASIRSSAGAFSSAISLATFHALESLMRAGAASGRLSELYRTHTAEVVQILRGDPSLMARARQLIADFQPGVAALLAGRGSDVTIPPALIQELNQVWSAVEERADPGLKAALKRERTLFGNFQPFANQNFIRWADLLALPVPDQPRIHLSAAARDAGGFHVEINDVPGSDFALWRTATLEHWSPVEGTIVARDGFTRRFTDPAPPMERALYEVRPLPPP